MSTPMSIISFHQFLTFCNMNPTKLFQWHTEGSQLWKTPARYILITCHYSVEGIFPNYHRRTFFFLINIVVDPFMNDNKNELPKNKMGKIFNYIHNYIYIYLDIYIITYMWVCVYLMNSFSPHHLPPLHASGKQSLTVYYSRSFHVLQQIYRDTGLNRLLYTAKNRTTLYWCFVLALLIQQHLRASFLSGCSPHSTWFYLMKRLHHCLLAYLLVMDIWVSTSFPSFKQRSHGCSHM